MKKYVVCAVQVQGFHCWPDAPDALVYLRSAHRHIFEVRVEFSVSDSDREIEIIKRQNEITRYLISEYGDLSGACQFGGMSCEHIAEELLTHFGAAACTVLEDGFGGARVVR